MKPDDDRDQELSALYRQSKLQAQAPTRIKRFAVEHASSPANRQALKPAIYSWASLSGACIAGCFLIYLIVFSQHRQVSPYDMQEIYAVEWHGFEENVVQKRPDYSSQMATFYSNYRDELELASSLSHRDVKVLHIGPEEIALLDCNKRLLRISKDILGRIQNQLQHSEPLHQGSVVQLAFNQGGYITGLTSKPDTPTLECKS